MDNICKKCKHSKECGQTLPLDSCAKFEAKKEAKK